MSLSMSENQFQQMKAQIARLTSENVAKDKALRLAVEALERLKESDHFDCMDDSEDSYYGSAPPCRCGGCLGRTALTACREAMAFNTAKGE